jgi:hypothetical protein
LSTLLQTTDLGDGYTIDQLCSEDGTIYYRTCFNSICRYCEDEYMSRMYAEQMGYNPAAQ